MERAEPAALQAADPAHSLLRYGAELAGAGSAAEVGFIAVHRLGGVLPYRMAVLLLPDAISHARVAAVSHLSEIDENSPFAQWLGKVARRFGDQAFTPLTPAELPPDLAGDGQEWMPEHAALCRLVSPAGHTLGWLLVAFEKDLSEGETALLQMAAGQVSLVLGAWQGRGWRLRWRGQSRRTRRAAWVALAALVGILLFPVRLSALAPAEVTPLEPASVAASVEGVLARFTVPPNAMVKAGTVVALMDDTVVRNRHAMALKALEIARAEFARAGSKSFADDQSRSELLVLKARIDEKAAEVAYTEELLSRIQLRAPVDGLVIYSSPDEWVGKPLATGERIASVADPRRAGLTLHLPAEDAIDLRVGSEVVFYQNVSPLHTLDGRLTSISYETQSTVDAGLAYVLRADFDAGTTPPQLGVRGTARVYGERVVLGYYLLRRPIAAARRLLGL